MDLSDSNSSHRFKSKISRSNIGDKLRTDYYYVVEYKGDYEVVIPKNVKFPYKAKRYFAYCEDSEVMDIYVGASSLPPL